MSGGGSRRAGAGGFGGGYSVQSFGHPDIRKSEEIGRGGYGRVFLLTQSDGTQVTEKRFLDKPEPSPTWRGLTLIADEWNAPLMAVSPKYLPCYGDPAAIPKFDALYDSKEQLWYLHCTMGVAPDLWKSITTRKIAVCPSKVIAQLMEMAQHLQEKNLIFVDGKIGNFGWQDGHVVFLDLDTLKFIDTDEKKSAAFNEPCTYTILQEPYEPDNENIPTTPETMEVFGVASFVIAACQVLGCYDATNYPNSRNADITELNVRAKDCIFWGGMAAAGETIAFFKLVVQSLADILKKESNWWRMKHGTTLAQRQTTIDYLNRLCALIDDIPEATKLGYFASFNDRAVLLQ